MWFAGEKIGEGIGRTRREAQRQAAEESLMNLAGKLCCCLSQLTVGNDSTFAEVGFTAIRSPLLVLADQICISMVMECTLSKRGDRVKF